MFQRHSAIISFLLLVVSLFAGYFVSETVGHYFSSDAVPGLFGTGATLMALDLAWRAASLRELGWRMLVSLQAGGRLKLVPLWCVGVGFVVASIAASRA